MDFLINSWYNLEQEEKDYFQNKSKKELQDRWKTEEGIEIRRRIIEICFARGKSKNYAPYVGYCTSSTFQNELLLDLRGLDLSDYSNLFDDIIVTLDFSFCNLEKNTKQKTFTITRPNKSQHACGHVATQNKSTSNGVTSFSPSFLQS